MNIILDIPDVVVRAADHLRTRGYRRAEAFPIGLWREQGWPESEEFFEFVDAYLRFTLVIEKQRA